MEYTFTFSLTSGQVVLALAIFFFALFVLCEMYAAAAVRSAKKADREYRNLRRRQRKFRNEFLYAGKKRTKARR